MTNSITAPLTTHDTTRIDDTRIGAVRPLITPALLDEKLPVPQALRDVAYFVSQREFRLDISSTELRSKQLACEPS